MGMATDFVADNPEDMKLAGEVARRLGLWFLIHDVGSGDHLHVQGLPPGEPPYWWRLKYSV